MVSVRWLGEVRLWVCCLAVLCASCQKPKPEPFPVWSTPQAAYKPSNSLGNAFDGYVRAALMAEEVSPELASRVSFTPGQRAKALKELAPALEVLTKASNQDCRFEFYASDLFETPSYHKGWRLLGRCLAWRIEAHLASEKPDLAMGDCLTAIRFGLHLLQGGAQDASLGIAILTDSRQALAVGLGKLQPKTLEALTFGLTKLLKEKRPLSEAIENERLGMLARVQAIQDHYQKGDFEPIRLGLGQDGRELVRYLERLREKDGKVRVAFFSALAGEIEREIGWLKEAAGAPVSLRKPYPDLAKSTKPVRKLVKHLFYTGRPLLSLHDQALARTRLLALEAWVLAQVKKTGKAPLSIEKHPHQLTQDPYSGQPLVYRADANEHMLYSVGENLRDDGGESDASLTQPDLFLEGSR